MYNIMDKKRAVGFLEELKYLFNKYDIEIVATKDDYHAYEIYIENDYLELDGNYLDIEAIDNKIKELK